MPKKSEFFYLVDGDTDHPYHSFDAALAKAAKLSLQLQVSISVQEYHPHSPRSTQALAVSVNPID